MSSYFEENRKFLGLNGVLGRRDFIVNCMIIEIIEALICSTPVVYLFFIYPDLLKSFSSSSSFPNWYLQWVAVVGLISSLLYFSSILRRTRDILGVEDENKVNAIAGILTVVNFCGYLPFGFLGKFLSLFVLIYLAFQKGTITGVKPVSEVIKFNWGAFLGTWLWGLFNKTPITLLMIPLFFTFGAFPFMILCGLKGNEWAYKNKKCDDVEKFHNSQQNQAILWLILMPVLSLIFSIVGFGVSGAALYKYSKTHPEFKVKVNKMLGDYQVSAVESSFDKIEVKDGVYGFYIDPEDWEDLPETLMRTEFKNASTYALIKEGKFFVANANWNDYIKVMNNVKILSSFNNEVLAEFYLNPEGKDNKQLREELKKGYKFNKHPSMP